MIIITTHAAKIGGKIYEAPANTLVEVLKGLKKDFLFIRHSIDGGMPSFVYFYKSGKLIKEKKLFVISRISILRYITEICSTIFFLLSQKTKSISYIGIDPLNAFSGTALKKMGIVQNNIYYTPDYSPQRFSNKLLNSIYHDIDKLCVKNADEIWNVSSRIYRIRQKMATGKNKNLFVPNMPSAGYKKYLKNIRNKFQLITLGIIDKQLDFINLFDAILELKNEYPNISLKIIGNGPKEKEYRQYILKNNLQNNVVFLGYLNHQDALKEISQSGIGLALYNGKWGFNYYGDSMKCREYFCFGLPVITTDTHSTVDEIKKYGAGIICKPQKDSYKQAIIKILKNYKKYSNSSVGLAKKYDNIHMKLISKL